MADLNISQGVHRDRDYGTNKLVGEIALGADIHLVCNAGIKVALSLLSKDAEVSTLKNFMQQPLKDGQHFIIFGMEPNYYFFSAALADTPGQYAFQSVWLNTTSRNDCSVCGKSEFREPI